MSRLFRGPNYIQLQTTIIQACGKFKVYRESVIEARYVFQTILTPTI